MADKSKMSVAEILAAARKADSGAGAGSDAAKEEAAAPATPAEPAATVPGKQTAGAAPTAAKKPAAAGGRPSVAEMLAMARGDKKGDVAAAATAVPPVKEKPTPKPVAKPQAASKKESPLQSAPLDTQSILAAARKSSKPGPMTKAEAAAKGATAVPEAKKARAKEAIIVPPMPAKPDYAKPPIKRAKDEAKMERRALLFGVSALAVGFFALGATFTAWVLASTRFMFPNILREPPSRFTVGFPDAFPAGQVEEKYKAQFGVWVVNTEYNGEPQIFALKSVCTHLGCTPNWLEAEQKFKCPCHGSGFYKDGINFEGPAPRPLERYAVSVAPTGEIEVDKSRTFQEEMGQWADPSSYIPV